MNRSVLTGRDEELSVLQKCLESDESEFVVVYGRRRVGKTFLVNEFFGETFDFKVTGLYHQPMATQLKNFEIALREYGLEGDARPADWLDAFALLKNLIAGRDRHGRKKVIFMDELPWLDTPKSGFLAAFESFWNGWASARKDVLLVVCGSATTWITKNLLENAGGLFNRVSRRMYLLPFTLKETEEYLQSRGFDWNRYEIAQAYMIMGGIPFYLRLLDPAMPLAVNIDNIFFKRNGPLWNEFRVLYETLFGRSELYYKIVRALSSKRSGLTAAEISALAGIHRNGMFSTALKNLEDCNFIRVYNSFGKKSNDKIIQLCDFYTLFYFRFLNDSQQADEHYWSHSLDNPAKAVWAGYSFEQVCKDHLSQIKRALSINGMLSSASEWRGEYDGSKAQIDLVIDRRDQVISACEMKFSMDKFVIDKEYEAKLRERLAVFKGATRTRKAVQLVMVTTYGVKKNSWSGIVQGEVTLDDLFM